MKHRPSPPPSALAQAIQQAISAATAMIKQTKPKATKKQAGERRRIRRAVQVESGG